MDLGQRVVELAADAGDRFLGLVALRLQTSDGFSRSLAVLSQLLCRPFELVALRSFQSRCRRYGRVGLDEPHDRRCVGLDECWSEGYLIASFELCDPRAQCFKRAVALLQFELLLV